MADENTMSWDEVDVTEDINEADQKASEDINTTSPVGKFLVTVTACDAIEKSFKAYSCVAAKPKFRIDKVIMIERPLVDDKGKAVKRNGETVQKVQNVPESQVKKINDLLSGQFITDEINLFNPKEKDAMKNRRLFVAKKLRLVDKNSTQLPTSIWPGSVGCTCIIETEWNYWVDKITEEKKRNVRVKWDGYDFAPSSSDNDQGKTSGQEEPDTSFDTEEFDI